MSDEVTVGSLESQERGQGARKSAGKPQWWQLPWWTVREAFAYMDGDVYRACMTKDERYASLFDFLSGWQRGAGVEHLVNALIHTIYLLRDESGQDKCSPLTLLPVVRVLEFGAKKYAVGNWTKGMPWSVCFSCVFSHFSKAKAGEKNDEESGLSHVAHLACNLIFLIAYYDIYPEGDDRLPGFKVGGIPRSETPPPLTCEETTFVGVTNFLTPRLRDGQN